LVDHDPRGRKVELDFDLEPSLPPVRGDENRILQVLLNLGLNAVAAIEDRGTVEFETFTKGDQVAVRVVDSGPGVPTEIRDRIFEPYFTTKAESEGTGLGLFVSRQIVREAGGEIELEPPASDRGASFVVRFPRGDTTDSPSVPEDDHE
ncbi:MAG: sensor histidine kinase, partial [Bradymonadaceae bacterium]